MKTLLLFSVLFSFIVTWESSFAGSQRHNWFHDPFFQISSAIPECPVPVGPYVTEEQRLTDAHHRAERGTTCWLTGKCDRPNSYLYDQDIAAAFKAALINNNPFTDSTLWVTVQGRSVFIEGCAVDQSIGRQLEDFVRTLPYVEVAVAKIWWDRKMEPPYPVLPDSSNLEQ